MIKNMISKKGAFHINQLFAVILVLAVIAIFGYFIVHADLKKWAEFLPDFGGDKEDKVIEEEGVVGGGGEFGGAGVSGEFELNECIQDAFWANKDKNKINEGEKINPGGIFFVVEIGDFEKCEGFKIFFIKNVPGTLKISLEENPSEKKGNLYYFSYEVEDKGLGKSGEYSFEIEDKSGESVFKGYEIKVEGWFS